MVGRILHLRSKGIALGVTLVALLAVVGACAGGGRRRGDSGARSPGGARGRDSAVRRRNHGPA